MSDSGAMTTLDSDTMAAVTSRPIEKTVEIGYGVLACKVWGDNIPSAEKFIAIHGYLDNAASFDPLMKYFVTSDRCVVCIDLPGHGLSSHLPEGIQYSSSLYLQALRVLVQHLEWPKFSFVGHSMGASKAHLYGLCWPEEIETIICLDERVVDLELWALNGDPFADFGKMLDSFLDSNYRPRGKLKSFSWSNLCDKWLKVVPGLTERDLSILMERGARKLEDGSYTLLSDSNVITEIYSVLMFHDDLKLQSMKSLHNTAQLLIISDSKDPQHPLNIPEVAAFSIALAKSNPSMVEVVRIKGAHHFHMQQAEELCTQMNKFLSKNRYPALPGDSSTVGSAPSKL